MAIKGMYQVILFAEDMQKMVVFYRDVFGFTVQYPQQDDYTTETWVTLQAGNMVLALHSGGKHEYIASAPQICFLVDDVAAERDRLIAAGVDMDNITYVADGLVHCLGRDPEGNKISIDYNVNLS